MTYTHPCSCGGRSHPSGRMYLKHEQCRTCDGIVMTKEAREELRRRQREAELERQRANRTRAKGGLDPKTGQSSAGCTWCGRAIGHHVQCPDGGGA